MKSYWTWNEYERITEDEWINASDQVYVKREDVLI